MIQIVKMLIGFAFAMAAYHFLEGSRLSFWQWMVGVICVGIAFDLMQIKRGRK